MPASNHDTLHEAISHAVGEMLGYGDEPEIANVVIKTLTNTPLSVILDATGHPYRTGMLDPGSDHEGVPWRAAEDRETLEGTFLPTVPVLLVPIPATDEAP